METQAPALRAFMHGLIDYAGLFPPAKLSLDQAIANYATYRGGTDSWMLGRFIIQTTRLAELQPHKAMFSRRARLDVAALGRGGKSAAEFEHNLQLETAVIHQFLEAWGERATAQVLEMRLPEEVLQRGDAKGVSNLVNYTTQVLGSLLARAEVSSYFEAGPPETLEETLEPVIRGILEGRRTHQDVNVGLKLRCGGVEASAFPSVANVARAIRLCRDAHVPLKCTAGLHHPIRHHSESVATHMHGFLNVFGAALLAHAGRLSEREIATIVECERADAFAFGDALSWGEFAVGVEEIRRLRRHSVISFGSCSFDEPREDLASLGLL